MKRTMLLLSLIILTFTGVGCDSSTKDYIKIADNVSKPTNWVDSISYTIGYKTGYMLWRDSIEINKALYIRGLLDGLDSAERAEMRLYNQQTMDSLFFVFDKLRIAAYQESMKKKEQTEKNLGQELLQEGIDLLVKNKSNPKIKVTESGLQYEILQSGNGPKATQDQIAKCHFIAKLTNGTIFANTYQAPKPDAPIMPALLPINRIPIGWSEAILLMPAGSKYRFYIPADLMYGPRGMIQNEQQIVPPNAVIIMEIEMIKALNESDVPPPSQSPR